MFVVMNRYSKMAPFIPCRNTADTVNIINLFFVEIIKLHGVPKTVTFIRDVKFVSHFWRVIWKKFGTTLNFRSAYHLQTDGQTKIVNKTLTSMSRSIIGDKPKSWDLALAQEAFTFNNMVNRSTRLTPCAIIYT